MKEQLYVDGIDVFERYGVYVIDGGYNDLITFPPLKAVYANDWHEWNGTEADLTALRLDVRTIDIRFAVRTDWDKLGDFVRRVSDGAYHDFNCAAIGRKYRLRLIDNSSLSMVEQVGIFSLKFVDDFPFGCEDLQTFNGDAVSVRTFPESDDYILGGDLNGKGGEPLTNWNVRVLDGAFSDILKSPSVKENMLNTSASIDGAEYDPRRVTFKEKNISLKCLMRATTLEELWQNWDSLRSRLTREGLNRLYVKATDDVYDFYYKGCTVSSFSYEGKIWLQFELSIVFVNYRSSGRRIVLLTEDGDIINTENIFMAIDLGKDGNY